MIIYYKATRPDGTDFRTGTIDYAAALVFPERAVGFLTAAAFVLAADAWTKALNSENARRNDERRRRETAAQLEKMRSERRRRNTRNIGEKP